MQMKAIGMMLAGLLATGAWGAEQAAGPAGLTDAPSRPLAGPAGTFSAAPDEAAAETVAVYLRALADGDYSKALFFVDLPGLRSYLLNRRIDDLKRANPGLSQKDLAEISSTFQTRELAPDRVKAILVSGWNASGFKDMTWTVAGWLPAPRDAAASIAAVDLAKADGIGQRLFVALRQAEGDWMVAPDVLERMAEGRPMQPTEVPMPDAVGQTVEAFWKAWTGGKPDAAWPLLGAGYRARVTLEAFAAEHAKLAAQYGAATGWEVEHVRQLSADILAVGLSLKTRVPTQGLMVFKLDPLKIGWMLEDVQFRVADGVSPAPAAPAMPTIGRPSAPAPAPSKLAPSFKTDFKTEL